MKRKELLNERFSKVLINCELSKNEQIPYLEKAENCIINTIYEEHHGKRLFVDDVINHLSKQAEKRNITEENEVVTMLEELKSFKCFLKNLKKGSKGERFVSEAIDRIVSPNFRLKNVEIQHQHRYTEIDEIVITPNGIFLIEVKYNDTDMVITKEGNYVPINNQRATFDTINILEKLSERKYYIRNLLLEKSGLSINDLNELIHPVLVFANNKSKLFDRSNSYNIAYCYNIDKYIDKFECTNQLSQQEMNEFYNIIQSSSLDCKYDVGYDLENLKDILINGIMCIEENDVNEIKQSEEPKSNGYKWKFDPISSFIGSCVTGLTIGGGYILFKKYVNCN